MKNIIEVQNLSKKYRIRRKIERYKTLGEEIIRAAKNPLIIVKRKVADDFWALKDISFKMQEGEILGVIGPNGAGKTTLLKILSRITNPTEGKAVIRGRVSSLLEVGTGFHPELTGRENIFINGAILGMSRKEISKKFDQIVEFSGVEKFIDTPVKRYSSGMSVRLAFSVAACLKPEILLVDEVLAVGDAEFQKRCLGKMQDVSKSGRTVLFVSHNMPSIINLCPRTIFLESGGVSMDGNTAKVVDFYLGKKKDSGSAVSWQSPEEAPGTEEVKLKSVRVLSAESEPLSKADIDKDILVELNYWNFKDGERLTTSIHLINNQGVTVFTTFNGPSASLNEDPWYARPRPKGLYRSTCRIPGNFLNEGNYFVNVYVVGYLGGNLTGYVVEKEILSFNVMDTGGMRKEYTGQWLGVVRPRLAWKTEYIG